MHVETKKDISDREDIVLLINSFYEKVNKDDVIGYFFTDVVKVDWDKHLPVMYNFWEHVIFGKAVYEGNPIKIHLALDDKTRMEAKHFDQWIKLFTETIDELFQGDKAMLAKQRALSIATVMQIKLIEKHK